MADRDRVAAVLLADGDEDEALAFGDLPPLGGVEEHLVVEAHVHEHIDVDPADVLVLGHEDDVLTFLLRLPGRGW